jgi:hypothetical protein
MNVLAMLNYQHSLLFLYMRLVRNATKEEANKVVLQSLKPNPVWSDFMQLSRYGVLLRYYRLEPKLTYAQSHMDNIQPRNIQSLTATANAYIKGEEAETFKAILNELQ